MCLVYKYISVLKNSVYLDCIYFVIIACHEMSSPHTEQTPSH